VDAKLLKNAKKTIGRVDSNLASVGEIRKLSVTGRFKINFGNDNYKGEII